MCNTYTLKRDTLKAFRRGQAVSLTERQKQLMETDGTYVIRPTLPAPVFRADGSVPWMRWGFERPWAKAINNARIEKRGTMWKKAWEQGRCLIPMAGWYEFTGPAGHMSCHLMEEESARPLLAAGLWEDHEVHGLCFTMIMAEAAPGTMLGDIHNRMPVILTLEEGEAWLLSPQESLVPSAAIHYRQSLVPSPLKKHKPTAVQGELF